MVGDVVKTIPVTAFRAHLRGSHTKRLRSANSRNGKAHSDVTSSPGCLGRLAALPVDQIVSPYSPIFSPIL